MNWYSVYVNKAILDERAIKSRSRALQIRAKDVENVLTKMEDSFAGISYDIFNIRQSIKPIYEQMSCMVGRSTMRETDGSYSVQTTVRPDVAGAVLAGFNNRVRRSCFHWFSLVCKTTFSRKNRKTSRWRSWTKQTYVHNIHNTYNEFQPFVCIVCRNKQLRDYHTDIITIISRCVSSCSSQARYRNRPQQRQVHHEQFSADWVYENLPFWASAAPNLLEGLPRAHFHLTTYCGPLHDVRQTPTEWIKSKRLLPNEI